MTWLVLDAMGVLYEAGDDVADVLVPYVRERGCTQTDAAIGEEYRRASLGQLDTAELWRRLGVAGDDAEYCSRHRLMPGIEELLGRAVASGMRLACLSNDVATWSRLLRDRFGLDRWIDVWAISGDLGARKPDAAAYAALEDLTGAAGHEVLFLDDRPANVAAARARGWRAEVVACAADCRAALEPLLAPSA